MEYNYRTHTCGELRAENKDEMVHLCGWVHRRRDHGGVIFIDLRDRYGLTQLVFNPDYNKEAHAVAESLRHEDILEMEGKVQARLEGMVNDNMPTGGIEVYAHSLHIASKAKTPPFSINDAVASKKAETEDANQSAEVSESLRLKYRYLDMRKPALQQHFILRHHMYQSLRAFLNDNDFLEMETPILTKATPEGARDYLVPSRVHPGSFYALPQSPQLFKQLFMMSGFDRYYQIARCFRDEDLRADRQPEFTQLDMEMSFVNEDMLFLLIKTMLESVWEDVMGKSLDESAFVHMTYDQAMNEYGSDKPDLRWSIAMRDISDVFANTDFNVFKQVLSNKGDIRGIRIPGGNAISRNQVDQLVKLAQSKGAKGMVWLRNKAGTLASSIEKFLSPQELQAAADALGLQENDLGLIVADSKNTTASALNAVKYDCIKRLDIPKEKEFAFVWVTDFPMFEFDESDQRFYAMHHPFTQPELSQGQNLADLSSDEMLKLKARAYDIVLNGYEIGGGSIRIHDSVMQEQVFSALGISKEEAREKFGFFIDALAYGAPPHGGIAFGLDRLSMILSDTQAIRDVIAFPKTQNATDLMCQAPANVPKTSLDELHIMSVAKKPNQDDA